MIRLMSVGTFSNPENENLVFLCLTFSNNHVMTLPISREVAQRTKTCLNMLVDAGIMYYLSTVYFDASLNGLVFVFMNTVTFQGTTWTVLKPTTHLIEKAKEMVA